MQTGKGSSSKSVMTSCVCASTSLAKHFLATGVRITGPSSSAPEKGFFWATGILVDCLKGDGSVLIFSDRLKFSLKMGPSWSAQVFRQEEDTWSGPGALLVFLFSNRRLCRLSQLDWGRRGVDGWVMSFSNLK